MHRRRKKKFLWLNEWHIWEQEAWFSDMAASGWKLMKIGNWFATFEQSSPQHIKYRCDIFDRDDPQEHNTMSLYRQSGWEHVASRKYVRIFREREAGQSLEIPVDPIHEEKTAKVLTEGIQKKVRTVMLTTILALFFQYLTLQDDPLENFLADGFIFFFLLVMIYVFYVSWAIIHLLQMKKILNKLKTARQYEQGIHYPFKIQQKRLTGFGMIAVIFVVAVYTVISLLSDGMEGEIPIGDLIVIRVADVIDQSSYQLIEDTTEGYSLFNHYGENHSLLVPRQYELHEDLNLVSQVSGRISNPATRSYRYEARNNWLAKHLVNTMKKTLFDDHAEFTLVPDHRFDEVWLKEMDEYVEILVRDGHIVYGFSFYHEGQMDGIVEKALLKIESALD